MSKACEIEDCDTPAVCRGWCQKHYVRWRKYGDPLTVAVPGSYPRKLRVCSVEGCDRKHFGQGYCELHHTRWRKHGDPFVVVTTRKRTRKPVEERFQGKYERRGPDDCWPWTGARTGDGYGIIGIGGRDPDRSNVYAHRLSYEIHVGPIPAGHEVDHLCFNTSCVNPAHLEPVTPTENKRRARVERDAGTGRMVSTKP